MGICSRRPLRSGVKPVDVGESCRGPYGAQGGGGTPRGSARRVRSPRDRTHKNRGSLRYARTLRADSRERTA